MEKRLLIIDGNSMMNRSYYGVRPLSNAQGFPTNALYGFSNILKKHIDSLSPDLAICAFDLKAPTFRHKMYSGYKANRHPMPEELAMQMPYARQLAEAIGFNVITLEGYEADDILGTSAMFASKNGVHTYIVTGDRDLLQLVSRDISVVLIKNKEDILFTPEKFKEEYGVESSEYVDVKALMGDSSDNIPGAAGIGEKTAFKLISDYHSLNYIYENMDSLKVSESIKSKLTTSRDNVFLSRELATINTNAPLTDLLENLKPFHTNTEQLQKLFSFFEFSSMMSRFVQKQDNNPVNNLDLPAILGEDINELPIEEPIFLSVTWENDVCLLSVYNDSGIHTAKTTNKNVACFLNTHSYITFDAKNLYKKFGKDIEIPRCSFDTMLADWLLDPGRNLYPLPLAVEKYLHIPSESVQKEYYSYFISKLYPILTQKLEENDMSHLLKEVEQPLSYVLSQMELEGFHLDAQGLYRYSHQLQEEASELEKKIHKEAGCEFNIRSPKQLADILYDRLGLSFALPKKGKLSTDAETLEKLLPYHPIIQDILTYRALTKLLGTYGENLIEMTDEEGQIHTTFNQTGTATGRLSSADPNLQNIPTRSELGKEIRKYFTASKPDRILIDADYSQIELRLLACLSEDETMIQAFNSGFDIHASTASEIFHIPMEAMTSSIRSKAKAINFGIVYGIGPYSLSQDLHISLKEAKEYIDTYLSTYPKVEKYLNQCKENAHKNGFVTTYFRRKRPLPDINSQNRNIQAFNERVAMNSPIQGTAADVIKMAMIIVFNRLKAANIDARLILQVHDELIIDCSSDCVEEAKTILKESMEDIFKSHVSLTVSLSQGFSWYDAK